MAQQGIVKPIEDWERNFWSLGGLLNGKKPERRGTKPDTSWHDSMVKAANESFLKAAEPKRKVGKKPVRKAAKKRTAPLANKRVGRKR